MNGNERDTAHWHELFWVAASASSPNLGVHIFDKLSAEIDTSTLISLALRDEALCLNGSFASVTMADTEHKLEQGREAREHRAAVIHEARRNERIIDYLRGAIKNYKGVAIAISSQQWRSTRTCSATARATSGRVFRVAKRRTMIGCAGLISSVCLGRMCDSDLSAAASLPA